MKRLNKIGKPIFLIAFGILLLLVHLNGVTNDGSALALAIIGLVVAAYYIARGVYNVLVGDKLIKNVKFIFSIIDVAAFAELAAVTIIINIINFHDLMGPAAWVISIFSLLAFEGFVCLFILNKFNKKPLFKRFTVLCGILFIVALLLDVLFSVQGNPVTIGQVNIVYTIVYALFACFILDAVLKEEEKVEEMEEAKPEEAEPEEAEPEVEEAEEEEEPAPKAKKGKKA